MEFVERTAPRFFLKEDGVGYCDGRVHVETPADLIPSWWRSAPCNYESKQSIREAGIQKEKLTIALEPEPASIYCKKLKTGRVEDTTDFTATVKSGMKYMVIDLGGTTALQYERQDIPRVRTSTYGTLMQQSSSVLPIQMTTESAQHSMIETIIAANRSFLIEEINTMTLVRAFQDIGITCFDGLDGTLGRQQRAESFLTILEKNNLLDQLLDILCEQGMTCVLDRLNNCRNAYSADAQILKRNIFSNIGNIIDNLDIDDVREMFIEREVFSSSMFHEIEDKYSESGVQMFAMLIEILRSEPRAGRLLVDVLYINQLDSLADSLLKGTQIELQEMKDNTQTDESSSDDMFFSNPAIRETTISSDV